jgi:hypothetical protein
MRKNMRRRHKLSSQTDDSIEETITTTATTVTTAVTPRITATDRNHVASFVIRRDVAHGNIPRRSKKSPRLSSRISLRTASRRE